MSQFGVVVEHLDLKHEVSVSDYDDAVRDILLYPQ